MRPPAEHPHPRPAPAIAHLPVQTIDAAPAGAKLTLLQRVHKCVSIAQFAHACVPPKPNRPPLEASAAPARRRRAAGAALAAALSLLFLACVFLAVRQIQYGLGAENGYRSGYAAGEADAGAGKPRAPGLAADRFPADYTFGSSAYKGYAVYWSSGYNDGYDARADLSN